jgi:3-deoxy-D-manno-octulosonate 8-phosphate phosphatase (KDO 8-P phosphatase)
LALSRRKLEERARRVDLLLMDVDGVLTDGRLYYLLGPDGKPMETKAFDSQDGIALWLLPDYGIRTGVISGRDSPGVAERARILGITYVRQNHRIKLPVFEQVLREAGTTADRACFVGDDLTDLPVLNRAGLAVAPSNARPEVKRAAHWTTKCAGGRGAVREVCELLLKSQGTWTQALARFT